MTAVLLYSKGDRASSWIAVRSSEVAVISGLEDGDVVELHWRQEDGTVELNIVETNSKSEEEIPIPPAAKFIMARHTGFTENSNVCVDMY